MGVNPFAKPLVASLCGTFLKPEMQSVYRQITGLKRHRTLVLTERRIHPERFPFEPLVVMEKPSPVLRTKRRKQRQRGNFIRRFYYKHLLKQWPPPARPEPPAPPPPPIYDDSYNLVKLLRLHQPRLVHVYYGHKAVKYLPMLKRWGGPFIVSFHGMDVMASAYKESDPSTLQDVFHAARLILGRSTSLLERLAELGCPVEKLRLNRTAIPIGPAASKVRRPPEDGRWIFLQACRLIAKKGIFTTLRSFRGILEVWPQAVLIFAGSGPLEVEARGLSAKLGLQNNVEFAGWCSQERLAALYANAHLFLHPSEMTEAGDREGVPNTLLEAMATGLPAVATFHGGIPEAVTNSVDGWLVPERCPEELGQAVLRITRDSRLLHDLSFHAAANVEIKFGLERQLRTLENYYQEAMEG